MTRHIQFATRVICLATAIGLICHTSAAADGGKLQGNTVWSGYVFLDRDVIVPKNATLTIKPDTLVMVTDQNDKANLGLYEDLVEIKVYGRVMAQGTAKQPISFLVLPKRIAAQLRPKDLPKKLDKRQGHFIGVWQSVINLKSPPVKGNTRWGGIHFEKQSQGSLQHCQISGALEGVFAEGCAPSISDCILFNSKSGIAAGNRSKRTLGPKGVNPAAEVVVGFSGNPIVNRCFVFRCEEGMVFINNCRPSISNSVISECKNGIHYLHTHQAAFPKIDHCLILKAREGILNRAEYALITNSIVSQCDKGLVIWASQNWPIGNFNGKILCNNNVFWFNGFPQVQKGIMTYNSRLPANRYQPLVPIWFRNIEFVEPTFRRADYAYPPDGDWRLSAGSPLLKKGIGGVPVGLNLK